MEWQVTTAWITEGVGPRKELRRAVESFLWLAPGKVVIIQAEQALADSIVPSKSGPHLVAQSAGQPQEQLQLFR